MARNSLNSKDRYELSKYIKGIEGQRDGAPRLSNTMLAVMATEHFGRPFSQGHIRNTRIMMGYGIKTLPTKITPDKEMFDILQIPPKFTERRRIVKKAFRCPCGQHFEIRIKKCK